MIKVHLILAIYLIFSVSCKSVNEAIDESPKTNDNAHLNKDITKSKSIAKNSKCSEDVKRICPSEEDAVLSNFDVLECIHNRNRDESSLISKQCHHIIWSYKYNLTQNAQLEETTKQSCYDDLTQFSGSECDISTQGLAISCLIQNINKITDEKCRLHMVRIGSIVFSDYHLISRVTNACQADVQRFGCGRVQSVEEEEAQHVHSQGRTIECLSHHAKKLDHDCKHEIFKLAELQSEDFRLDRAFYFACRDDRDRLCGDVRAGRGKVYKCLLKHRNDRQMSGQCVEQLSRRETLTAYDFEASSSLARACKAVIRELGCRRGLRNKDQPISMARILLCLEDGLRKGKPIDGACQAEMMMQRQVALEASPLIVEHCKSELLQLCQDVHGPNRIHCLFKHFRKGMKKGKIHEDISAGCQRALESVIHVADPAEDWRVDPVLREACLPVVQSKCHNVRGGEGRVMRCLMRQLNSPSMIPRCESALLEVQYFVVRDWKLDPQLFVSCRNDSAKFCHAHEDWTREAGVASEGEENNRPLHVGPDNSILVLPCLFRYAYHPQPNMRLSAQCAEDVRRVMHERAAYVQLHPRIEMECMETLSAQCSEDTRPGQEMLCLQRHLETLEGECANLIKNYTEAEAKDVALNSLVITHCSNTIDELCRDVVQTSEPDDGAVMECLIRYKNSQLMRDNYKCRAVVENFQMVMITDISFTPRFKQECHESARQYCSHAHNRKAVLDCLSGRMLHDVLNDDKSSIPKTCKQQVRVQLTARHENSKLDEELRKSCFEEISQFCSHAEGPGRVLECLRGEQTTLSSACHRVVFVREEEESANPSTDVILTRVCKQMMTKHCADMEGPRLMQCLLTESASSIFDTGCREILMRRMVERSRDARLQPMLFRECHADAQKLCSAYMPSEGQTERNGKLIECLKESLPTKKLSSRCAAKVIQLTKMAALHYNMDPILLERCNHDLKVLCKDSGTDDGEKLECMKLQLERKTIKELACSDYVAKVMQRQHADIEADPVLYSVCVTDDRKMCADMPKGKHLGCLLDVLDRNPNVLERECREKLRQRREMFKVALKMSKLESVGELVVGVRESPQRHIFAAILLTAAGIVFIGGLACGRATRRATHALLKNR